MTRALRASAAPTVPARPAAGPVRARRPDADAWALALREAGGDARRCEALADGSVLVRNQPRRR